MSLTLSGPFDTSQLPKIAADPVTITVARTVVPGNETEYLKWAADAVAAVSAFPGCLGAGLLRPGPDGGDHQTVFRFVDGVHLRRWERSPERAALMVRAEAFVSSERVQRTVGVESFFDLPARAEPSRPLWTRVVTDVAWVYPVSLTFALVIAPWLARLPLMARVLVSGALVTVLVKVVVSPMRSRLRRLRSL
jgi:antibiotic biosynthesis monooxygenase (ABM) superfamily enzyme